MNVQFLLLLLVMSQLMLLPAANHDDDDENNPENIPIIVNDDGGDAVRPSDDVGIRNTEGTLRTDDEAPEAPSILEAEETNSTAQLSASTSVPKAMTPEITASPSFFDRNCSAVRWLTFKNDFGGHNNQLLTLLNAFEIARVMNLTLDLPDFIEGIQKGRPMAFSPYAFYNFDKFRRAGYCFARKMPLRGLIVRHTAYRIFRVLPANVSRPYAYLRPSKKIKKEVVATLRRLPTNYTAVHRRMKMFTMFDCRRRTAQHTKPAYCWYRKEQIRTAQVAMNMTELSPIFEATDSPGIPLTGVNTVRYRPKANPKLSLIGAVVDWFVLSKAALMLGHPSSSLSLNVCNFRRSQTPPKDCYQFEYCWDRPPYVAGWPCGSPVPGIDTRLFLTRRAARAALTHRGKK